MNALTPTLAPLRRARNIALVAAGVGTAAIIAGWISSPEAFYRAYLHGWLLWLGVSLGSMGLTMIIHLLGGSWGSSIRRLAEAAAMVLPLLAVLFIPIAIGAGLGFLFPWAHGNDWRSDPILVHRRPYLNLAFFLCRAAIFGFCWIGLAWLLWRWGRQQDESPDGPAFRKLYALSGPGLVLYILTMGLFAATDWILALEPHYKSTVFGLLVISGQGVSALCVLIAALFMLSRHGLLESTVNPDAWNDLASVLLTATMLWCYLVVCQFIVNWMGNTQDENHWYLQRMSHGWYPLNCLIAVLHLLLPLLLLLLRGLKRNPLALALICLMLFGARALVGFTMVNASGADPAPLLSARFSWQDVVLPLAIGAGWVLGFIWMLDKRLTTREARPVSLGAKDVA